MCPVSYSLLLFWPVLDLAGNALNGIWKCITAACQSFLGLSCCHGHVLFMIGNVCEVHMFSVHSPRLSVEVHFVIEIELCWYYYANLGLVRWFFNRELYRLTALLYQLHRLQCNIDSNHFFWCMVQLVYAGVFIVHFMYVFVIEHVFVFQGKIFLNQKLNSLSQCKVIFHCRFSKDPKYSMSVV